MMFWGRKGIERIAELEARLESKMEALVQAVQDGNAHMADTDRDLKQLQGCVREQGMSIEDMLEEWNERKTTEDMLREQLGACEKEQGLLLELFEAYQEQFRNLRRFAEGKDEAWAAQIDMIDDGLGRYRQSCGIGLIGECGTEVDYDMHEVIEVIETGEPELDRRIADIYSGGYMYRGKVRRKAKVAVYALGSRTLDRVELS